MSPEQLLFFFLLLLHLLLLGERAEETGLGDGGAVLSAWAAAGRLQPALLAERRFPGEAPW